MADRTCGRQRAISALMSDAAMSDASPYLFRTSQPRELLACTEFCAMQSGRVAEDPGAFRWMAIVMVLAVQNACLCALDWGDEFGTKGMTRRDAQDVKRWTREGRTGPKPIALREFRIVSPLELLERVSDERFLRTPFRLMLSGEMRHDFDALNELRNTFIHYSDDAWSVDLREIPPLVIAACGIIRHLAVTQPIYLRNAERGHSERVGHALETIIAAMEHYLDGAGEPEGYEL
jgi:hypothetical protein